MLFRHLLPLVAIACLAAGAASAAPPPRPKLIIAISIDQFSADLFAQYRGDFTGGLKRLQQGAVFPSGYQSHAATETCPGHSTILSGMHPSGTGIVGNRTWSPRLYKLVYCIDDGETPVADNSQTRSPKTLKATTLGTWLKAAEPGARVFAVAGKDRAAIPMGGADADGEFFWNEEKGGYTTFVPPGTTAEARLKPIAAFNAALLAKWRETPPAWTLHGPRCAAMFGPESFGGVTSEQQVPPLGAWTPKPGETDFAGNPGFQNSFRASPEFDRVTLELVEHVIDTQKLGRGPATDLIAIGLSATDYVGHRYGPESPQMCDQLAWLDARLGAFLTRIDALHIPYIVMLTADHGSIDAAERAAERGIPAQRIDSARIIQGVNDDVRKALDLDFDPLSGDPSNIMVNGGADPALHARLMAATLERLRAVPEIAGVFTKDELLAARAPRGKAPDAWTMAERFAASTDAERSTDIQIAWAEFATPFAIGPATPYVAGHGSPWNYDRRVPILFWWPEASGFEQPLAVETVDIAPTLAAIAGIKAPPVDGRCLDLDKTAGDSCAAK